MTRTNKVINFCAGIFLVCSVFGTASAHTHGVITAVEVAEAPVIDASLTGWKAPFVHVSAQTPSWFMSKSRIYGKAVKSPEDIEAWYSVAWKGDKIFFAAIVLDDVIIKNTSPDLGQAWNSDSVEIYFSFNHDSPFFEAGRMPPYRAGDFQLRFVPFEGQDGVYGGAYLGNHASDIDNDKFQAAVKSVSKPYTSGKRSGYVIEASIDTAALGFSNLLQAGKVLGFEFAVNDADTKAERDRMLTWSSFDNRAYKDPSCFGDLVLAGPTGTFVPATGSDSGEKEGYYLIPGEAVTQTLDDAIQKPLEDDSPGRVVYTANPPAGAKNISGMFDPSPYRPIAGPEIRYCQVGYLPIGKKTAYLEVPSGDKPPAWTFSLSQGGKEVYSGPLRKWGTIWRRDYYYLYFNDFTGTGQDFTLSVGNVKTQPFPITTGVYDATIPMALNGVFVAEKCGTDASTFHGPCHLDDAVQAGPDDVRSGQTILQFPPVFKPGTRVDVSGGWHDAGDFGKYMGNAPLGLAGFLLVEDQFHTRMEPDLDGKDAMVHEAEYTADWCLKMQDKDGGVFERVWNGFDYKGTVESEKDRLLDSDKWANVTARWAAAAAMGAQILQGPDPDYAAKLAQSAQKAWEFIEKCPPQPDQPWAFGVYPGNDSCFFWAAVELYRLTLVDKYLQEALKRLPAMLSMKPAFMAWSGNNTIALIRFYPVMPDGADKDSVKDWLLNRMKQLDKGETKNPFGVDYFVQTGWGNSGDMVSRAMERYLIKKILPESGGADSVESYRQWIYGANPSGYCFVVGRGSKQVQHQATGLKKNMPGAVVPGIIDDGSGLPFYIDADNSYLTNEAGPDPSVLFASYMDTPWNKALTLQDPAETKKEAALAQTKPSRPDPSVVADFNSISADSIWTGGGNGGSLDKSIVETAPGGGKAFRGDFKVGEWCTSVVTAGGDLSTSSGLVFQLRGNNCRLRVAIDDANAEDWGTEVTASADWKPVTLYFTDLVQPPWTVAKDKLPLDLKGTQKFKVQPLSPTEGWFEVANVRKTSAPAPAAKGAGLLKLAEGDSLWTTGDGGFKLDKSIDANQVLHVNFAVGKWCMTGASGKYMAGHYQGFKFKAKGAGVGLRMAVQDTNNHDFGKSLTLTGDMAEYTVLFSELQRAPWETEAKDAPLDTTTLSQFKIQPMTPAEGEFWISDFEWVK